MKEHHAAEPCKSCHLRKGVEGNLTPSYVRVDGERGSMVLQLFKRIVNITTIHHQDVTSIKLKTGWKQENRIDRALSQLYLLKSPCFL
jgi:hypothetical protein